MLLDGIYQTLDVGKLTKVKTECPFFGSRAIAEKLSGTIAVVFWASMQLRFTQHTVTACHEMTDYKIDVPVQLCRGRHASLGKQVSQVSGKC